MLLTTTAYTIRVRKNKMLLTTTAYTIRVRKNKMLLTTTAYTIRVRKNKMLLTTTAYTIRVRKNKMLLTTTAYTIRAVPQGGRGSLTPPAQNCQWSKLKKISKPIVRAQREITSVCPDFNLCWLEFLF
ncbi:hypothetical protein JZ751_028421 [Albula glossodonta]|uniref:Uncharacterized protein n=1 Tax=Albula glossodonta TaxID=121402 RepID=A0A8T2MQZ8_9TELE|nr:hypothetical protein JZ751_028421 [Albula glossodonta]